MSNTYKVPMLDYLIQHDSPNSEYPFRVVTLGGVLEGYFKNFTYALAYCQSQYH